MPAYPEDSTAKFQAGGPEADPDAQDTTEGEVYSDPDSAGEPALMISQAQADAAGMTGAMPGDTFTVKVSVDTQNDAGWNVSLMPGSAVKDPGPSMEPEMGDSMKPKGPGDLGMPTGLGQSPTILNT